MNKEALLISVVIFIAGVLCGSLISRMVFESDAPVLTKTVHTVPDGMHIMPDGTLMPHGDHAMGDMDHGNMMVSSEREFVEGMIPHHQEAVDTAREVLARGATTPEIKTLVENIIAAQEQEIAMMKQWHEVWYGEPYSDTGEYAPMMRDLKGLSGVALDTAFLEDMIMHHMGAIMMAQSVLPYITHPELSELTNAIMMTQSREIETMRRILESL